MTMTWSPSTQSWATWLEAMMRQWRPSDGVVALVGGAVDGHVLAHHRIVAEGDPHRRALAELEVLRHPADDRAVADPAAGAHPDPAFQHHVRADLGARADAHLGPDDRVGADPHVGGQLRPGIDHRGGVDHARRSSSSRTRFSRARTRLISSGSWVSPAQIRFISASGRLGMPPQTSPAGTSLGTPDLAVRMAPAPIVHVIGDAHLPRHHRAIAHAGGAGDAHLGHQDHVLADVAVVPDLDQVVDLGAAPHHRVAEGGAVDGGIGPDLHVVLDAEPADLRDLAVHASVEGVAEAVGAEHRAGVDDHPVADLDPLAHDDPGMEPDVLSEHGPRTHERQRPHPAARADHRARVHHRERAHRGGPVDPRVLGHARRGVRARARSGASG